MGAATAMRVDGVSARAYTVPTDKPEADGTFDWTSTTLIVEASADGQTGLGYRASATRRGSSVGCVPILIHAACAVPRHRYLEWFHDHVRIKHMLLDGRPTPKQRAIPSDRSRPGLGPVLRQCEAERYLAA